MEKTFYIWRFNTTNRRRYIYIYKVQIQHGYDGLYMTYQNSMETTFYIWRPNTAWRRRFIYDVPIQHGDFIYDVSTHTDDDLSIKYEYNMETTVYIYEVATLHGDDVLSVTILQWTEFLSVTFKHCMDTTYYRWRSWRAKKKTFYQWRSYSAWRRR